MPLGLLDGSPSRRPSSERGSTKGGHIGKLPFTVDIEDRGYNRINPKEGRFLLSRDLREPVILPADEPQTFLSRAARLIDERTEKRCYVVDPEETLLNILAYEGTNDFALFHATWVALCKRFALGHLYFSKYVQQFKLSYNPPSPASTISDLYAPFIQATSPASKVQALYANVPHHREQLTSPGPKALPSGWWSSIAPPPLKFISDFKLDPFAHLNTPREFKPAIARPSVPIIPVSTSNPSIPSSSFSNVHSDESETTTMTSKGVRFSSDELQGKGKNRQDPDSPTPLASPLLSTFSSMHDPMVTETPSATRPPPYPTSQSSLSATTSLKPGLSLFGTTPGPTATSTPAPAWSAFAGFSSKPRVEKGDPGPAGGKGERGERGERGPKGESGKKGTKGEKGEKGDKGERGMQGLMGPAGAEGPSGPRGPSGSGGGGGDGNDEEGAKAWSSEPYIKNELKVEDLPKWNGEHDSAMQYFWKISHLASLGEKIRTTLERWMWKTLEQDCKVYQWYTLLSNADRETMREDYREFVEVIKQDWLGSEWVMEMQRIMEVQSFWQKGYETESPAEFIGRRTVFIRLLSKVEVDSREEIELIMLKAPTAWKPILHLETIESTRSLLARVVEHRRTLIYVANRERGPAISASSLAPILQSLGISMNPRFRYSRPD
ncbi:hypothetical protein BDZ89DRAFT_1138611 [Hymenopellis radicata]|nr:hypothetical protein BDZ89DRAFT_1138611 [Hymenopellis radicata]